MKSTFYSVCKIFMLFFTTIMNFHAFFAAPCSTTVLWHNLSDAGCGVNANDGITTDVIDQNIDVIGINALVDGIHVQAQTCDILISVTNQDSVITGSGNRCDGVLTNPAQLYLFAATGRTITVDMTYDLTFRGTANGSTDLDLLVTFSGGGQLIFNVGDGTVLRFTSGSGGTQFFIAMDQPTSTFSNVIFQRLNQNSSSNVEVVIGNRSCISFMSESGGAAGYANVLFDPQNQNVSGDFILRLLPCGCFSIVGHEVTNLDADITLADISLATPAGLQAIIQVGNPSFNGQTSPGSLSNSAFRVINQNFCCTDLFIDPFCQGASGFNGVQNGFILGPRGALTVNNFSYLDYIGTTTNLCCQFVLNDDCGNPQLLSRLRNGSAFIVDAENDQTPAQILLLGRSAIYFRSGVDKCGVVDEVNDFVINADPDRPFAEYRVACAGCIVFDVEGPLLITGSESSSGADDNVNGINILSLQVTTTGCPVIVGDTGAPLFPQRTFARNANGEYLRYNSGAMLANNAVTLVSTNLIHTDENHAVFQEANRGNGSLSSEPTYIGGDTYLLCKNQVAPPFVRTQCVPFIAFVNSFYRVNTSVASTGVDFVVPNYGIANESTFVFYNNGRCIDAGYGRNMILGTDPCFDNGCYTSTGTDSQLDVMAKTGIGGSQVLNLITAMNDACITEGIIDGDTGNAVQTIFLNNSTNLSIGNLNGQGIDCFGNTFTVTATTTPQSQVLVLSPCFSFETLGGSLQFPQSSGSTGQGGIFVDTNGLFSVPTNAITNIGAMVTKSGNGQVNLPKRSVFFAPRIGIQDWNLNLTIPANRIVVPVGQSLSNYSLDWGSVIKEYCCTNSTTETCFRPYEIGFVGDECSCPPVTFQNLTALPTVQGVVEQFQVIRTRLCDTMHLMVDGGQIDELVFLVGFNSAEAPIAFIAFQNDAQVGLGSAHKDVDSLNASVVLGVNGVQLCANGSGTIILNEDVIINNVCPILRGPDFGLTGPQTLKIYSTEPRQIRITKDGALDLSQFNSIDRILEVGGQVTLVADPGARIILSGGGQLKFSGQARFELAEVLDKLAIQNFTTVSDSDDYRVRVTGQGTVSFTEDSTMFIGKDTYFGIETDPSCSLVTSVTFAIFDQASVQIGGSEIAGGTFQVGDTGIQSGAIDFSLILEGQGAEFLLDSQGLFAFGAGVVDKSNPIPNNWTLGCLQNVRYVNIDIPQGTFIHNQIASGDDSLASLLAIGNQPNMQMTFNFDIPTSVIRGGGNIALLSFAVTTTACVDLVPTVSSFDGTDLQTGGTVTSGIMAGKLLLVDGSKGAQPFQVTPIAFYNYIKTDTYSVPFSKKANVASTSLNQLTLGYVITVGGLGVIQRPVIDAGFLRTGGGNPTQPTHSLEIGAVSFLVTQGTNTLSSINEIIGNGSF